MGFGIIRDMGTELKPTLWRTARALANPDRLNLMRLVANAKGAKGVADLANGASMGSDPMDGKLLTTSAAVL